MCPVLCHAEDRPRAWCVFSKPSTSWAAAQAYMFFHSVTHLNLLLSLLFISFQRWLMLLEAAYTETAGWRGDGPYFLEALHLPGREAGPVRRWLPVCLSLRLLTVLFPGVLQASKCPSDHCPDRPWWLPARSSTVFRLPLWFPGCPSSPLAPCWMKTAEPRTQCWRDTLWPVK